MTSTVEIANVALSEHLGCTTINAFSDDTPEAVQVNLHYGRCLRALLEMHWWNFARGRQILAELTNDRTTEWAYKYARPADALTIRWVNEPTTARSLRRVNKSPDTKRHVTLDAIYSDVAGAACEYTRLMSDPATYSQMFRDALSARLAVAMAKPLTENSRLRRDAIEAFQYHLDLAMVHDASEEDADDYAETAGWLQARGIGTATAWDDD